MGSVVESTFVHLFAELTFSRRPGIWIELGVVLDLLVRPLVLRRWYARKKQVCESACPSRLRCLTGLNRQVPFIGMWLWTFWHLEVLFILRIEARSGRHLLSVVCLYGAARRLVNQARLHRWYFSIAFIEGHLSRGYLGREASLLIPVALNLVVDLVQEQVVLVCFVLGQFRLH